MPAIGGLTPSGIYHVCSRGNNRQVIFHAEQDRRRFLDPCEEHGAPRAETFAYCLLPNHFHLLLRFREIDPAPGGPSPHLPSQHLSNLLNAYARTFNRDHNRVGALFQRPFRRVLVQSQAQLLQVSVYIHVNPQRHGLVHDFRRWRYSSYAAILSAGPTHLTRDEVLAWFGGHRPLCKPTSIPLLVHPMKPSGWTVGPQSLPDRSLRTCQVMSNFQGQQAHLPRHRPARHPSALAEAQLLGLDGPGACSRSP